MCAGGFKTSSMLSPMLANALSKNKVKRWLRFGVRAGARIKIVFLLWWAVQGLNL
jgi:hypothetical protein